MTISVTILWWHWVVVLGIVGVTGFYLIARKASGYDFGTPMLGFTFWAVCWSIALGILIGNCRL